MSFVLVSVHCGPFRGYDRTVVPSGNITFTPAPPEWVAVADDSDYVPRPVKQTFADGEAVLTLVAPADDSTVVAYDVTVHVDPDLNNTFRVVMPANPADGETLELTSRDPDTGLLGLGTGGGGGGGFGGDGHGGFGA